MNTIRDTLLKLNACASMLEFPSTAEITRKEMLRLVDVLRDQLGGTTPLAPDRAKSARKSKPSASKRSKSGAAGKT